MSIGNGHILKDRAYEEDFEDGIARADEAGKLAEQWEANLISDDADKGVAYLDTHITCEDCFENHAWEDIFKAIMTGDVSQMQEEVRQHMHDMACLHIDHQNKISADDH